MAEENPGWGGFGLRLPFALLLVFATFNPSGYSYLNSTMRSLGIVSVILAALFFAVLVWVAVDFGLLEPDSPTVFVWIGLFVAAAILAAGMSWSHIRRRLSGQADVDEIDSRG